jgi:hypothetical protein
MGEKHRGSETMPLSAWLAREIAAVKASLQAAKYANAHEAYARTHDLGYLAALEKVADRLLNEELTAGAADEIQGNLRRFGVA